jgi:sugar phosphate permease
MGPELIKELALDASQFGLMGLTFFWTYALANFPAGSLVDRFGSRNSLLLSLLMVAIGCFIFSVAQSFSIVIIGRMITAVANAAIFIAGVKLITVWFTTKQFPELYGIWMGLGTLGSVFATAPLQSMMTTFGWRNSFAFIAAACIGIAVLVLFLVKGRPADVGLLTPDEIAGEAAPKPQATAAQVDWWTSTKELLSMPRLWLVIFYFWGTNASGQVIVSLWGGILLANVYGFGQTAVSDILTYAAFGMVVGCIAAGWINKRIGAIGVMLSATTIFLISWLYMTMNIRSLGAGELKILYAVVGFVQMYAVVAGFTVIRQSVPTAQVGTAVGLANAFAWIIGAGLCGQIWGMIIKHVSKGAIPYPVEAFETAMWVQAITLVVSFICAVYLAKDLKKSARVVM